MQCHIHIVLVQHYIEPANNFNLLLSKVSELFLSSSESFLNSKLSSARLHTKWFLIRKTIIWSLKYVKIMQGSSFIEV